MLGGAGAIWGSSEVLMLRTPENSATLWRPIASVVGFLFFLRWCKQLSDAFCCGGGHNHFNVVLSDEEDEEDNDDDVESLGLVENDNTNINNQSVHSRSTTTASDGATPGAAKSRKDPDAFLYSNPTFLAEDSDEENKIDNQANMEMIKTL